jgi:hypothetical protein
MKCGIPEGAIVKDIRRVLNYTSTHVEQVTLISMNPFFRLLSKHVEKKLLIN